MAKERHIPTLMRFKSLTLGFLRTLPSRIQIGGLWRKTLRLVNRLNANGDRLERKTHSDQFLCQVKLSFDVSIAHSQSQWHIAAPQIVVI